MTRRRFLQCDVFSATPVRGNGLAVVVDGDGLNDEQMQAFAAWTNLAETTFLLTPTTTDADYRVRIFTPTFEMPFAGHPTLGSCACWLASGGKPRTPGIVRQECPVGTIEIDISRDPPAFKAPPTTVEPLADERLDAIIAAAGVRPDQVLRSARLCNGPVWLVVELASADLVLAVDSDRFRYPEFEDVGLIGAYPPGSECDYEVRMLAAPSGPSEDPITGSLNAAIACWMYGECVWKGPVTVGQGTVINRDGSIYISRDGERDAIWIGGHTHIIIEGAVDL